VNLRRCRRALRKAAEPSSRTRLAVDFPRPWGALTRSQAAAAFVAVDESAEQIASPDRRRWACSVDAWLREPCRHRAPQGRARGVAFARRMPHRDAHDTVELVAAEGQEPVEALPSGAADPALDVCVRPELMRSTGRARC
jgi:hypothetical protein